MRASSASERKQERCGGSLRILRLASLMMKRTIPSAALTILPRTGHALNLEEPLAFNNCLADFFHQVEADRWTLRDPRSLRGPIL